jgi:hypothetical protein
VPSLRLSTGPSLLPQAFCPQAPPFCRSPVRPYGSGILKISCARPQVYARETHDSRTHHDAFVQLKLLLPGLTKQHVHPTMAVSLCGDLPAVGQRLAWLRSLFPDSDICTMVRRRPYGRPRPYTLVSRRPAPSV